MRGDPRICRRCSLASAVSPAVICDPCVTEMRDDAALAGLAIAEHSATLTDHRSPGERRRED